MEYWREYDETLYETALCVQGRKWPTTGKWWEWVILVYTLCELLCNICLKIVQLWKTLNKHVSLECLCNLSEHFNDFFFKKTSIRVNLLSTFYVYTCVVIKERSKCKIKMKLSENKLKLFATPDIRCRVYMV